MTSMFVPPEWPPSSLRQLDVKYCQAREVLPGASDADLYVIHMAGLLYHQDWLAARHLFRCSGELEELKPWYEVAKAALKPALEAVWASLGKLHSNTSYPFVQAYVNEISHAFRLACLSKFSSNGQNIPAYLAPVLGFSTIEEMSNFVRECFRVPVRNDHLHIVAAGFLQSRLTADLSTFANSNNNDDTGSDVAATAASS